jgi:hypothetical protein
VKIEAHKAGAEAKKNIWTEKKNVGAPHTPVGEFSGAPPSLRIPPGISRSKPCRDNTIIIPAPHLPITGGIESWQT